MNGFFTFAAPGGTPGDVLANLGEVFGSQAQFPGIPGDFALLAAVLLDHQQEAQEVPGCPIMKSGTK